MINNTQQFRNVCPQWFVTCPSNFFPPVFLRFVNSCYLNSINSGPEHRVVVLHGPPVLRPVRVCQVTAILLQDIQSCRQALERCKGLKKEQRKQEIVLRICAVENRNIWLIFLCSCFLQLSWLLVYLLKILSAFKYKMNAFLFSSIYSSSTVSSPLI